MIEVVAKGVASDPKTLTVATVCRGSGEATLRLPLLLPLLLLLLLLIYLLLDNSREEHRA